jgi:hypothetical protein
MGFPSGLTPPSLATFQWSYNGVLLGASAPLGVLSVTGLADLADIRSNDPNQARANGQFIGLDLYGGRDVTFHVFAKTDGVSLQDTLTAFAAATVVGLATEQPLWFQLPNLPLLCVMCRPRKRAVPIDKNYEVNVAYPVAQFHATDPNIYAVAQTASVGL